MTILKKIETLTWLIKRPKTTAVLTFFVFIIITFIIVLQQYQLKIEDEIREKNNILQVVSKNITYSIKSCYTATLTLALAINEKGNPENFEQIGAAISASNSAISAVKLIPKGIIKYVYPFEENKDALNFNILKDSLLKKEALKSIETKKMYFAGPLKLKQGGTGIVGRLPIFRNNQFWGFSTVVIKLENLLKSSGINTIDATKYYFQFSKKDPLTQKEVYFLPQKSKISKNNDLYVTIPDGDWQLHLITLNPINFYYTSVVLIIMGLIIALLFSFLIYTLLKIPENLSNIVAEQSSKLLDSQIIFRAIFDQATVGIALIDGFTGNFIEINQKYRQMLGYNEEEFKNKSFKEITHPDDLLESDLKIAQLKKGAINEFSLEKRYFTKSDTIIWSKTIISQLQKTKKSNTLIAIIEDITLKKEAEKELNQSYTLVTEQNKRLLNFSYIISHNLRSHTSNITSIIDLIVISDSEEEKNEMIQLLKSVSNSLNDTMVHLNEVINIRTNIDLALEPLNLNQNIEMVTQLLSNQITEKEVTLSITIPQNTILNYNPAYLESILYNLISNAIRYRSPKRKPRIEINWYIENEYKVLKITDNGIGIDLKQNKNKIFGMYKTFTKNPDSKGIGLFITKNQIDAMGGKITIESEIDKGTTFRIYFK